MEDVLSTPYEVTRPTRASTQGWAELEDSSFDAFYRLERDRVVRALAMTLGDLDVATEATDEAMARAYQRWTTVGRMESPGGWVFRVGLNWSRSLLLRRRRAPAPLFERDRGEHQLEEPDVLVALSELDLPQRSVVVLRLYLGLSEAETATALRIPAGTVKSRLHRATRTLQVRLHHLRPDQTTTPHTETEHHHG